jgi:hypothetical protein
VAPTGPTGVGKSWLASALGYNACSDNRSVLYHRVPKLFEDLMTRDKDILSLDHYEGVRFFKPSTPAGFSSRESARWAREPSARIDLSIPHENGLALNVIHRRNVFGISGEGIRLPQVRLKNLLAKLAPRVAFRQEVEKLLVHERAATSDEGGARQTIGWLLSRPIKREFFVRRLGTRYVDVSEQSFQSIHDPWPCRPASAAPERLRRIGPQLANRVESVMAAERHAGFQQQQIATASSHRAQCGGGILQMIQKPVAIHDFESSCDRSIQRFHIALNKFPA